VTEQQDANKEIVQAPKPAVSIEKHGLAPTTLDGLWRVSEMIAASGLAPSGFDNDPRKICVALSTGLELGLPPMKSIQSIAVIHGRPTLWGDAMIGLVHASGQLEDFEEDYEPGENGVDEMTDDFAAICTVKRRGFSRPLFTRFSVADAKKAKLWGKSGPWTTHPKRMLRYKARAFALRDMFADVLGGLHMYEEMQGEESSFDPSRMKVAEQGDLDGLQGKMLEDMGGEIIEAEVVEQDDEEPEEPERDPDTGEIIPDDIGRGTALFEGEQEGGV